MIADTKDQELEDLISGPNVAGKYFFGDENCPIDWEPSGFDFLSPCLQVLQKKSVDTFSCPLFRLDGILSLFILTRFNFIKEADAMSRMPTMSNYTMFHEWLNKFLPGIYSDDFSLTPGNFSDAFNTLTGI